MASHSSTSIEDTPSKVALDISATSPMVQVSSKVVLSHSDVFLKPQAANSTRWWQRGSSNSEKKLVLKLDFYIMSWACFGYFIRLLDTSNICRSPMFTLLLNSLILDSANAYVSGMKEDLQLFGDQYNFFTTYWTIGYIVGMIPSQIILSYIRPSVLIPTAEILWAILTFCFAAVQNEKQIYAMRFLIGLFEAPFYVGAMTLLGNWYTPTELGKRASIFYSASFAANMFSGYLQAAVYNGLNGSHGIEGWRWLFIMCGVITVPGAIWGFLAVPDSPFTSKAWYLSEKEISLSRSRMVKLDRRLFKGIKVATFKKVLFNPWCLIFVLNYILFCIDTNNLSYFAIWIKSLNRYSIAQVNVIPTGAFAIGFVFTILFGILSDRLNHRPSIAIVITIINIVSSLVLATHPSTGGIFYGYFSNAASYCYGPIMISWLNEYFTALPDERALVLGIAQTMGATFNAWLPLLIFNTGTQAPLFNTGFIVCTVASFMQAFGIVWMWWLSRKPALGVEIKDRVEEQEVGRETVVVEKS